MPRLTVTQEAALRWAYPKVGRFRWRRDKGPSIRTALVLQRVGLFHRCGPGADRWGLTHKAAAHLGFVPHVSADPFIAALQAIAASDATPTEVMTMQAQLVHANLLAAFR